MEFQKYGDSFWNFFLWNSKDFDLEFFLGFFNSSLSGDELTEEWIQLPFSHLPKFDPFFQEFELNVPTVGEMEEHEFGTRRKERVFKLQKLENF
jgi:hypothetical protein